MPAEPRPITGRGSLLFRHYVALGDSLTEGVGDVLADRSLRGWAALLAAALTAATGTTFTNLGERGATAAVVRRQQLPVALSQRPDLVTLVVGVNDVLWPGFRPARFAADLAASVEPLVGSGAAVVLATLHDPGRGLRLPGPLARRVRASVAGVNAAVRTVADRHGALVLDIDGRPELAERAVWSVDRLHPSERGHRLLAAAAADLLVCAGHPPFTVPLVAPAGQRGAGSAGHVRWLLTDGGPWLAARYAGRIRRWRPLADRRRASPRFRDDTAERRGDGGAADRRRPCRDHGE